MANSNISTQWVRVVDGISVNLAQSQKTQDQTVSAAIDPITEDVTSDRQTRVTAGVAIQQTDQISRELLAAQRNLRLSESGTPTTRTVAAPANQFPGNNDEVVPYSQNKSVITDIDIVLQPTSDPQNSVIVTAVPPREQLNENPAVEPPSLPTSEVIVTNITVATNEGEVNTPDVTITPIRTSTVEINPTIGISESNQVSAVATDTPKTESVAGAVQKSTNLNVQPQTNSNEENSGAERSSLTAATSRGLKAVELTDGVQQPNANVLTDGRSQLTEENINPVSASTTDQTIRQQQTGSTTTGADTAANPIPTAISAPVTLDTDSPQATQPPLPKTVAPIPESSGIASPSSPEGQSLSSPPTDQSPTNTTEVATPAPRSAPPSVPDGADTAAPSTTTVAVTAPAPIEDRSEPLTSDTVVNDNSSNDQQTSTVTGTTIVRSAGQTQPRRSTIIDWRFRISLAESAQSAAYLYNSSDKSILSPLKATNGVIFPYTPKIDIVYSANYEQVDITHSNYKFYNYKNSSVDSISISGDFTAQDTNEANYLLAVIHFFRSVTKMFYGKDQSPVAGTPPPLCYLSGHGAYAFDRLPVVITSFQLNYPNDVDYINARVPLINAPGPAAYNKPVVGPPGFLQRIINLRKSGIDTGGLATDPIFRTVDPSLTELTRVPTKLSISLSANAIVTRNDLSNNFSLKKYASGELLRSNRQKNNGKPSVGGFW